MNLSISIHGQSFRFSCGEGQQTFKWLGLVAAQRYALLVPHGRCRTREDAHSKLGFYIPSTVRKADGSILDPNHCIKEKCTDGEAVIVELQLQVPVDETGAPSITSWAKSAFCHNEESKLNIVFTENSQQVSKFPHEHLHEDEDINVAVNARKEDLRLQVLMTGRLRTQEEIDAALDFDWVRINIDEIDPDQKDQEFIKDVLGEYFVGFNSIFKHYGIGQKDDEYRMSIAEFSHFTHESNLFNFQKDFGTIKKIFFSCMHREGEHIVGLRRFEFVEAILKLIRVRCKLFSEDELPVAELIENSLREFFKPTVDRLTRGPLREGLHSDPIVAIFLENLTKLTKAYNKYAIVNRGSNDKLTENLITANEFRLLIQDSGLLCSGTEESHQMLVESSFLKSFSGQKDLHNSAQQVFVFAEFLEVVCRIASSIWKDEDMSPKEITKIAIEAVRALA